MKVGNLPCLNLYPHYRTVPDILQVLKMYLFSIFLDKHSQKERNIKRLFEYNFPETRKTCICNTKSRSRQPQVDAICPNITVAPLCNKSVFQAERMRRHKGKSMGKMMFLSVYKEGNTPTNPTQFTVVNISFAKTTLACHRTTTLFKIAFKTEFLT